MPRRSSRVSCAAVLALALALGRGSSTAHRALGDWRLQVSAQIAPAAAEQPNGRTAVQADLQSQSLAVKSEPGSPLFSPNLLAQLS